MSPGFSNEYGYMDTMTAGDTGALAVVLGVYVVILLLALAFSVLTYVLQSIGLYTISKRRGIHHSWLSWLPIGNMWILGSISDQYQYVAKGKVRSRRKVLLGIMIAIYALMIPLYVSYFGFIFSAIDASASQASADVYAPLLTMGGVSIVMFVVAIVGTVFQYNAYYDLFASSNPDNAVLFLVLSIFVNVTLPFFVFASRKKDLGMPPRKTQQQTVYEEVPTQPEPEAAPVYLQEPVAEEADFEEPAGPEEETNE